MKNTLTVKVLFWGVLALASGQSSGAGPGFRPGCSGMDIRKTSDTPLSFAMQTDRVWPELFRLANLDNASVFRKLDRNTFGTVNLSPERADGQWGLWAVDEEGSWTHRTLAGFLDEDEDYRFSHTASRLSPAVLFYSTAEAVRLFSNMKLVHYIYIWGGRNVKPLRALYEEIGAYYSGKGRGFLHESGKDLGGTREAPISDRYTFTARPQYVAFCGDDGEIRTLDMMSLFDSDHEMGEPWILAWWGKSSHIAGPGMGKVTAYWELQQGDQPRAADFVAGRADMPVLLVLQNNPLKIELDDEGLTLRFMELGGAGHIRMLLPFGGKPFPVETTEEWGERGLPEEVAETCRQWTARLQSYPTSVKEEFRINPDGSVTIRDSFEFLDMEDDWDTPIKRYSPVPGMLGLAMTAGFPAEFRANGETVEPEDWDYFDYCGLLKAIEAEEYEYTIPLERWTSPAGAGQSAPDDDRIKAELERCVREMIETGHLAPHIDLSDGNAVVKFWWIGFGETVTAIAEAYPYLSGELQAKAAEWLARELEIFPHLNLNEEYLLAGSRREPYPMTPEMLVINTLHVFPRDADDKPPPSAFGGTIEYYKSQGFLRDLYGYAQYAELCSDLEPLRKLAPGLDKAFFQALDFDWFDWNMGGPGRGSAQWIRPQRNSYRFQHGAAHMNAAIAGAFGYSRLFKTLRDNEKSDFGLYLAARMMPLRAAMAMYAREYVRRGYLLPEVTQNPGYMPNPAENPAPWETCQAIHVDEGMFIVGPDMRLARHCIDTDATAMINITPEVGRLLRDTALEPTRDYLEYIDKTRTMWFLVQATRMLHEENRGDSPELYGGYFLANAWATDKSGPELRRYLARSKFRGDLCYIRNLAAMLGK